METRRQIIELARHGKTPNNEHGQSSDSLTPASVISMFIDSQSFRSNQGGIFVPEKVFVLHSDKDRTVTTAKARLAGIMGYSPVPHSQDELKSLKFNGIYFEKDDRLSFGDLKFNEGVLNRIGTSGYAEWMLANRKATELEGKTVTSFDQLYNTRRPVLGDAAKRLRAGKYDLGKITSHAVVIDAIALSAVDSARETPAQSYDAIGGIFDKEGVGYVFVDTNSRTGETSAKFVKGDFETPVNLDRIISEY